VQYEVVNDKVGEAFAKAADEAALKVAGMPRISQKDEAPEGALAFDATFEVYPEVQIGDLATAEVEKVKAEVTDAAIDKTLDILRKQRRTFAQRAAAEGAAENDRVTIDFEGKIDGEPFEGGKAEAFQFIIGEGQMLEQFDKAVRGMKVGDSKTFPLQFPADYHGKDVAGKEADFLVTMKKVEQQHLPEIDDAFAKSLMALTTNETVMLLIITFILLVAGMLLDAISIFMIFVPMLMPVVKAFGWDPTWFGIIVTMNLAIGSFTPPMAVNLMVTCRIAGCTIESTTRWVLWMVAAMGTSLLLVTFVPELALFLPRWAGAL